MKSDEPAFELQVEFTYEGEQRPAEAGQRMLDSGRNCAVPICAPCWVLSSEKSS